MSDFPELALSNGTEDGDDNIRLAGLLYRSTAKRDDRATLSDILTEARARNERLNLTGFLHSEDGLFFQWLEGPEDALNEVMDLIRSDHRHESIVMLYQGLLAGRRFGEWSMGHVTHHHGSLLEWLADSDVAVSDKRNYAAEILQFLLDQSKSG